MPKVSICIPTYNQPLLLKRLLDSVFSQTFCDFEVIISDDSTDDEIYKVVESLKRDNIKYIHNVPSLGPAGNWNKSISLAETDIIKIMHQDDFFTFNDSLEKLVFMLDDNPTVDFAFCGSRQFYSYENYYDRHITDEQNTFIKADVYNVYHANYIGAPSATIFRKKNVFFDSNLIWLIDVDFYISYFLNNFKYIKSNDPLVSIGINENQTTNKCIENYELQYKEYSYILTKHKLWNHSRHFLFFLDYCSCSLNIDLKRIFNDFPKNKICYFILLLRIITKLLKTGIHNRITKVTSILRGIK